MKKAVVKTICMFLRGQKFLPHLGKYQRSQLLDPIKRVCLVFVILSSKVSVLFSIPAATHFLPVSGIGCWEVSVPCHMFHFRGCLSVFMTWQLVFPRISNLKESGGSQKCLLWPSLEVTHCHFHSIPLITLMSPIHCGRKLHKSENTRKWGTLRVLREVD